jgi:hypothetical protein
MAGLRPNHPRLCSPGAASTGERFASSRTAVTTRHKAEENQGANVPILQICNETKPMNLVSNIADAIG